MYQNTTKENMFVRTKKTTNLSTEEELTTHFGRDIECIFDNDEDDSSYTVFVYSAGEKVIKTCNLSRDINLEYNIIKYIKDNMEDAPRFFKETTFDMVNDNNIIVMPKLMKFSTFSRTSRFRSNNGYYANQLLVLLHKLHKINVVHNDIKSDNFMYDPVEDSLIIIDFGNALVINDCDNKYCRERCYDTPIIPHNCYYRAPECFREIDEYRHWLYYEELSRLKKRLTAVRSAARKKIKERIEEHKEECPESIDTFVKFEENDILSSEKAFKEYNTLYADVYALGCVIKEYFTELTEEQNKHLDTMTEFLIEKRISSEYMDNVDVFQCTLNDEQLVEELEEKEVDSE